MKSLLITVKCADLRDGMTQLTDLLADIKLGSLTPPPVSATWEHASEDCRIRITMDEGGAS